MPSFRSQYIPIDATSHQFYYTPVHRSTSMNGNSTEPVSNEGTNVNVGGGYQSRPLPPQSQSGMSSAQHNNSTVSGTRDSPPEGYGFSSGYGGMCSSGLVHNAGTAESKIEAIKQWSISTYKCTRQAISEKLGKSTKTVDVELESAIESIRDTQKRFQNILRLSRAMASHFYHVVQTQKGLAEEFSSLVNVEPELKDELRYNAESQKALVSQGEKLLAALNFFVSSLATLCNKTIEDTLLTIKTFENARLEYDAYKADVEALQLTTSRGSDFQSKLHDAQQNCSQQKQRYEQLREDVQVKMKFLSENKVKVLQKQLLLFHNATTAYFTGNKAALDSALNQFNIQVKTPNASIPSWLEGQE